MIEVGTKPDTKPIETVTPLKPSEAMRLGRLLVPEWNATEMFRTTETGEIVAACAMGAMAIGYGEGRQFNGWVPAVWPEGNFRYPCSCFQEHESLWVVVTHLSDAHGGPSPVFRRNPWSDARIADFLEGLGL